MSVEDDDPMSKAVEEAVALLDGVAHRRGVSLEHLLANIVSCACGDEPAPGPRLRPIDGGKA